MVVAGYMFLTWAVYRFRHPDQSETELFLNFWSAMTWR